MCYSPRRQLMTAVDSHHHSSDNSFPRSSHSKADHSATDRSSNSSNSSHTTSCTHTQRHPLRAHPAARVVILIVGGHASSFRRRWEAKMIIQALSALSPKFVACTTETLARRLDEECASGARVWVHLIGHHCATTPNANRPEEILYLDASNGRLAVKKACVPPLKYSFVQMTELLKRPDIELVFFNASNTKALADCMTGIYSFGWASLCLEQGANAFAHAFYTALGRCLSFDESFQSACSELTQSKMKVNIPTGPRSTIDADAVLSFCDPAAWAESRKRKRQEAANHPAAAATAAADIDEANDTPLRSGLISGIGPTKLDKLSRKGVTTLEQLARCPDETDVGVAPKTLARWREIAQCKLRSRE